MKQFWQQPLIIGKILFNLILATLIILTILPTIDLPIATAVQVYWWLAMLVLDLLLIIAWFRWARTFRRKAAVVLGFLIVASLDVVLSQVYAATPPIAGDNSIAVMEKVQLNGTEQWITIRGTDKNKPVLLYLGIGGPGAGGFPASALTLKPLEDDFVVVNWDQPGTGKSYGAAPISTLTVDRFVNDAHELTGLLKTRFHQDKIYVLGLSWGTILGTKLVQQYPGDYYAYTGTGQMVNTVENDRLGYHMAIKLVSEKGNQKMAARLQQFGEPPYKGEGMVLKYAAYNDVLFEHMGSPRNRLIMMLVPQFAKEYGYVDKFNFARGLVESFTAVYPQLENLDFTTQANKMDVPMYFLVGKQDINAVASLVERYYNVLQAPYKELIWLESGHGATAAEIEDALVNRVLVKNPPAPSPK